MNDHITEDLAALREAAPDTLLPGVLSAVGLAAG